MKFLIAALGVCANLVSLAAGFHLSRPLSCSHISSCMPLQSTAGDPAEANDATENDKPKEVESAALKWAAKQKNQQSSILVITILLCDSKAL